MLGAMKVTRPWRRRRRKDKKSTGVEDKERRKGEKPRDMEEKER